MEVVEPTDSRGRRFHFMHAEPLPPGSQWRDEGALYEAVMEKWLFDGPGTMGSGALEIGRRIEDTGTASP